MAVSGSFDQMAPFYEKLMDAWSFGRIPAAKRSQLRRIEPGATVMYMGAGSGGDALAAAKKGAHVTCLDISVKMLEGARSHFARAGEEGDFVHADLFEYQPGVPFDVVVANFIFDCMPASRLQVAVDCAAGFLRPGGTMMIVDTGVPHGSALGRAFWHAYHSVGYLVAWLQHLTPWLPKYDYEQELRSAGCDIVDRELFRLWPHGPVVFENVVAVRHT
jgi:ubiquinone/menaquinone biosynthesis C-methylase UbiE